MSNGKRLAFSLMELLLIVGIVVLLVLLILPGVLKVRSAAARTETNNNLRECATAVHKFHDEFKLLPNGYGPGGKYSDFVDGTKPPNAEPLQARAMWFHLLPYVGAGHLYLPGEGVNSFAGVVPAYLAPSDVHLGLPEGKLSFAGNVRLFCFQTMGAGVANDLVSIDKGQPVANRWVPPVGGPMSGWCLSGLTLQRIPDGTSNTLMLATRHADCGGPLGGSPDGTMYYQPPGGGIPNTRMPGGVEGDAAVLKNVGVARGGFFGAGPHNAPVARSSAINLMFQITPDLQGPEVGCVSNDSLYGHAFWPSSISIALADGSVRGVTPAIGATVWNRTLCPGDGFTPLSDWVE
jgi:hypothetical protein